ncbi:MAG: hypothetical protein ED557_00850 [Balneola sp.]|nr:MAG: hypothetical protein ED557_00850 [Balneola sp.]
MGQQQLLLIILVTIIIGLGTVFGLVLFENFRDESVKDMIKQDMMEAANYGQAYYRRPRAMGGGSEDYTNIDMNILSLDTLTAITRFSITETSTEYFKITADPLSSLEDFSIIVYSDRVEWEE